MPYRDLGHSRDVGHGIVLREYAPVRRNVTTGNNSSFQLQMPYVIFAWKETFWGGGYLFVAFSDKPVKSKKDKVYCAPLGNIYPPSWEVCGCNQSSLSEAVDYFWNSKFTNDGGIGSFARTQAFGGYRNWAKIKNLDTILRNIKKIRNTKTLEQFLGQIKCKLNLRTKYPQTSPLKLKPKSRKPKQIGNKNVL